MLIALMVLTSPLQTLAVHQYTGIDITTTDFHSPAIFCCLFIFHFYLANLH